SCVGPRSHASAMRKVVAFRTARRFGEAEWPRDCPPSMKHNEVEMNQAEQTAAGAEEIIYEVRDRIGFVTFNRPQARNALTFGMYDRLAEICSGAPTDGSVAAIVITGAGDRAF